MAQTFCLVILLWGLRAAGSEAPPALPSAKEILEGMQEQRRAFLEITPLTALSETMTDSRSKRERIDALDTRWFSVPRNSVVLNLFSDAEYTIVLDETETIAGVSVFRGHVEGHEERPVFLAFQDGALSARIPTPDHRLYDVQPTPEGLHRIIEVDQSVRICGNDEAFKQAPPEEQETAAAVQAHEFASSVGQGSGGAAAAATQPTTIDVIVLYTTEAKNANGLSWINTRISLALAYMNHAFNRSGINARMRLVRKAETTWHIDSGNDSTELSWLKTDSTTASLRNTYGADLVSLLFNYTSGFPGRAECNQCTDGWSVFSGNEHTFAHELGHNFGCSHDRGQGTVCAFYSYSYGYSFNPPGDPNNTYGTIMSYVGSAIENYSSPLVYFLGAPTGLPEGHVNQQGQPDSADNARTINQRVLTFAACRSSAITTLDSPALVNNDTQFTFQIVGPNSGTYTVEFTTDYLSWSFLGNYVLSSGSVQVTDNIGSASQRFYRAKLGTAYLGTQIGWIKKQIPVGQSMVCNQLDNGDNTLGTLLPSVNEGTIVYKWNENGYPQGYLVNSFDFGEWLAPGMTLHPGEGVIINNPGAAMTSRFVGFVRDALHVRVPRGWAIRGSPVPQAGAVTTTLTFPSGSYGDQVWRMTSTSGSYTSYTWNGTAWSPLDPSLAIAEAFWSWKGPNAYYWDRVFWTWP